ncbi:MAG: HNH endonuclease [Chloroflexota bacterium]|jgi:5-methylcytosine-specific restriction endonuclease McrA
MQNAVLVLNANFEPLNVCNLHRAVGLVLMEKASLVLNGRGEINTVSQQHLIPSIIRLEHMIKRPHPSVKLSKREILRRDHNTCQYCGKHSLHMTVDHIIPRHLGGNTSWENMVTACPICNHRKGGRILEQAKMELLHPPVPPPASVEYLFGHYLENNLEWLPFVKGW